jgi:C_GCAxxG_C_C family probable redox protein
MMKTDRVKSATEKMASRKANCAQSVFTAFSADLGLDEKTAYSLAQGFGGGMGHTGGTCGAVTGAYLALGLDNPASKESPRQSLDKTYALVGEFNRQFKKLHGSMNCTELLGYDLSKQEELVKAREAGVFTSKCPTFVGDATKIVDTLLALR